MFTFLGKGGCLSIRKQRLYIIFIYYFVHSYEIIKLYNPSKQCCYQKKQKNATEWWHFICFWRHSMCAAQSTQNPAYIAYSFNLGFVLLSGTFGWRHSMCGTHFHITCKFPQNSPRNRSRAKVPDPIRHLKMAFYQGCFKILVPGGHSLGEGSGPPHSKFQSVTIVMMMMVMMMTK